MVPRRRESNTEAQPAPTVNEGERWRSPLGAVLKRGFYADDPWTVARRLLGAVLVHATTEGLVAARIVETEAYDEDDAASHSFRGPTERNAAMFGPPGHAYVYRSYGIHWCFNVVTGDSGRGAAVLLRAAEPLLGAELMAARRGLASANRRLLRGPGCLAQAFALSAADDRRDLTAGPLRLHAGRLEDGERVLCTPRIGITKETELRWRFIIEGNPNVSAASGQPRIRRPSAAPVSELTASGKRSGRRR